MPRTSLNETVLMRGIRTFREYINGTQVGQSQDNPVIIRRTRSRVTSNTPGFRTMKLADLPMRAFSYSENRWHEPYGWMSQEYGNYRAVWQGRLVHVDDDWSEHMPAGLVQSVNDESISRSLSRLKGMKVNLGVAFGERKQTSQLLLGTASRIAGAIRGLRQGNLAKVANSLGLSQQRVTSTVNGARKKSSRLSPSKAFANEWLALQYGWKPLLSDVYKSAEGLAALSETRRVKISAGRERQWAYKWPAPLFWNAVPATRTEYGRYSRKYTYIFSTTNEVLKDLSAWGVTNPASIAWELLPWSFVIDWFIPIGEYIDSWDATLGLSFEKGCVTTFKKFRVNMKSNGVVQGSTTYECHGSGFSEVVTCERSVLNGFVHPSLPDLSPYITFNRGVSAVALLRQTFKR